LVGAIAVTAMTFLARGQPMPLILVKAQSTLACSGKSTPDILAILNFYPCLCLCLGVLQIT
jgi:hypothetical protein